MTDVVFSVQDETGTVYQLTVQNLSPEITFAVGDTGTFVGVPDEGTDGFAPVPAVEASAFSISQVGPGTDQFSIRTTIQGTPFWPRSGVITWATGANAAMQTTVLQIDPANAYITTDEFTAYHTSRGTLTTNPSIVALRGAIVQATDYLDQKYRYNGIKLVQTIGPSPMDANAVFLQPWLYPGSIINVMDSLTPSTTPQYTSWPRQGAVDLNGNTINGIPKAIKAACAELALRVLNGVVLQPDFDSDVVANGAVVSDVTQKVGPIETTVRYDTKLGLGFFASFPQITRLLRSAGLLNATGRRTVMR